MLMVTFDFIGVTVIEREELDQGEWQSSQSGGVCMLTDAVVGDLDAVWGGPHWRVDEEAEGHHTHCQDGGAGRHAYTGIGFI